MPCITPENENETKTEIYIEIGDNLRSVLERLIENSDAYAHPVTTGELIKDTINSFRDMAVEIIKAKKTEKEK